MDRLLPALAAVVCAAAAIVWIRATIERQRVAHRLAGEQVDPDLWRLANNDYRRDFQTALFTAIAALALAIVAVARIGFWPSVGVSLLALTPAIALFLSLIHI